MKFQDAAGNIVEAVRFDPLPKGRAWPKGVTPWDGHPGGAPRDMSWGFIETPEGRKHVQAKDWIVTDSEGKQRAFRPADFEANYKPPTYVMGCLVRSASADAAAHRGVVDAYKFADDSRRDAGRE